MAEKSKKQNPEVSPVKKPFWLLWYVEAADLVVVFLVIMSVFLFLMHRSLSPVYLGNIRIRPNADSAVLQNQVSQATASYRLSLRDVNGKVASYPLKDTGISVDAKATVKQAKIQLYQDWLSRLFWWKPIQIPLTTKVDKDLMQAFLKDNVIKPDVAYTDAGFAINGSDVSITDAKAGHGQSEANPYYDLPDAVSMLQTKPIQLQKMTIQAPIKSFDLTDEKSKLQNILSQKISLSIDGNDINVTPDVIASWLDLNPVEHSKTIDITVNSGRVLSYLNKVAAPYVQPPRSRLIMTQNDGTVTVLDQGKNGVDIVNKDHAATDIAAKVLAAKGFAQNLDVSYAAAKNVEVQPYDKWIVVDVTTKRMYAYEQKNLVKSFLVSAGAPATPTVIGQYSIYAKFASQDMRGSNADGSRYFQPDVAWVNYFYKDYAIHGNYWRPLSYFGNINSSHGCVGVVNSDAEWVYDWAPIGTPVIVHA